MRSNSLRRFAAAATFLFLVTGPALTADTPPAPSGASGDLWEVTSRMSMEGMPTEMPAQKVQVCAPKEWKEPPGGMDERQKCESSDFKVAGPKATWKVRCAGPPEMTGEGEITRNGADAYTGALKFSSPHGAMTIKLDGRRLGDCDLGKK